jgi:predicted lipoprotein with Yx(FWY)xxD motif
MRRNKIQKRIFILLIVFVISGVIIAGCTQPQGWLQIRKPTINQSVTVQESDTISLGKTQYDQWEYLVDVNGMTLYTYENDDPGNDVGNAPVQCNGNECSEIWPNATSHCYGECSEIWPIFYVEKIVVSPPLKPLDFGTITRTDGKKQITYWGHPLYYYRNDTKPGDRKGEGIHDLWFIAQPAGKLVLHSRWRSGHS